MPDVHKLDSPLRGCSTNVVKFKSVQSAQLRENLVDLLPVVIFFSWALDYP